VVLVAFRGCGAGADQSVGVPGIREGRAGRCRDEVAVVSESEVVAVYPHRSEVPRDVWGHLFSQAPIAHGPLCGRAPGRHDTRPCFSPAVAAPSFDTGTA